MDTIAEKGSRYPLFMGRNLSLLNTSFLQLYHLVPITIQIDIEIIKQLKYIRNDPTNLKPQNTSTINILV